MGRTRRAVLGTSAGRTNVLRCVRAVDWVSRRLRRERVTDGRIVAKGRDGTLTSMYSIGEPFVSVPVVMAIFDTGLNGVPANTEMARERVAASWHALELEWQRVREALESADRTDLKALIAKTNEWIDATLHPVERIRLQGYLRQMEHGAGRSRNYVQIQIPRNLYERATAGVPQGKRQTFIASLVELASSSVAMKTAVLSGLGISITE